jgi:hypothetical protein
VEINKLGQIGVGANQWVLEAWRQWDLTMVLIMLHECVFEPDEGLGAPLAGGRWPSSDVV